jgi:hypothetical protein
VVVEQRGAMNLDLKRATVWRMGAADAAKRRASSSQLKATRVPASRMVAVGVASTWAAPRQLLQAVTCYLLQAVTCSGGTQHCQAHGGGRRCQKQGSKAVARGPGSMLCTLCLRAAQPQPDGA